MELYYFVQLKYLQISFRVPSSSFTNEPRKIRCSTNWNTFQLLKRPASFFFTRRYLRKTPWKHLLADRHRKRNHSPLLLKWVQRNSWLNTGKKWKKWKVDNLRAHGGSRHSAAVTFNLNELPPPCARRRCPRPRSVATSSNFIQIELASYRFFFLRPSLFVLCLPFVPSFSRARDGPFFFHAAFLETVPSIEGCCVSLFRYPDGSLMRAEVSNGCVIIWKTLWPSFRVLFDEDGFRNTVFVERTTRFQEICPQSEGRNEMMLDALLWCFIGRKIRPFDQTNREVRIVCESVTKMELSSIFLPSCSLNNIPEIFNVYSRNLKSK